MTEKTIEIRLPYGELFKTIHIPEKNLAGILETRQHPGLENERESILDSLRKPTGSVSLIDRINENDRVVIIVTDNTRACPEDRILPPLLEELENKISSDNITIIFALGLHPPLNRAQMEKKLGKDIIDKYYILNHDVNDCINIGTTSHDTPIDINRRVVEADFRISTGFIEPHFFAGFSGGRKSIAPGVFSVRSAYINHSRSMLEHPLAKTGILKGNPVHEDMIEIAYAAKLNFIINVLLNKKGEITHVVAGDMVKAHEKGCETAKEISGARLDRKVDITITTNSGAPLDLDLYQSVKGMETASHFTRDGGIIIICSACYDGAGPEEFIDMHRTAHSPQEVLDSISDEHPTGVQWQNQILANIQCKNDIYVVSDMDEAIIRDMMMTSFSTFEEALEDAFRRLGKDASIAVIPEGPLVIPLP